MPQPGYHRRASDPEDTAYPHTRSVEHDKVARVGDVVIRWVKPLLPFILGFVTWFMASVWQPIQQVPELSRAIQILIKNDSLSLDDRAHIHRDVNVMGRILCFNMDANDRAKYDIDCTRIPLPEARGRPGLR